MIKIALIMSAAYVSPNLRNEFGKIPPSFLPFNSKRLFQEQVSYLRANGNHKIYISVPDDYQVDDFDQQILNSLSINVLVIDPAIASGESFCRAASKIFSKEGDIDLTILFGDTLFSFDHVQQRNMICVGTTNSDLGWGVPALNSVSNLVYAGLMRIDLSLSVVENIKNNKHKNFPELFDWFIENGNLELQECSNWYDFGHLATFFQSSAQNLKSRFFNQLKFTDCTVEKESRNKQKMSSEIHRYQNLPQILKTFAPSLINTKHSDDKTSYTLELLYQPTLAALAVYGSLTERRWNVIFQSCFEFLRRSKVNTKSDQLFVNIQNKTKDRIMETSESVFDIVGGSKALTSLLDSKCKEFTSCRNFDVSYAHGDFCFSNILFDTRSDRVKVIDPRGKTSNQPDKFDFVLYDIAKLAHSVIGGYDLIIQSRYNIITENGENGCNFQIYQLIVGLECGMRFRSNYMSLMNH